MSDDDINGEVVMIMRRAVKDGLGFNTTFADDDVYVLVGLAQRAVLAGLASDLTPDMQNRLSKASEPHRTAHEEALGRPIKT